MEELVSISLPSHLFTLAVPVTFFTHSHCWLFLSLTITQFVSILSRPGPAVERNKRSTRINMQHAIPILEYDIRLTNERQELAESNFDVWSVDTKVATKWEDIPHSTSANLREAHGKEECRVSIHMDISRYKLSRVLCLFQDTAWGSDLEGASPKVEVGGKSMTIKGLVSHIHPLTGFIVGERNSHVKGYLIDGEFYGSLRIFDAQTEYHIHFFIEPLANLDYYMNSNKTSEAQQDFSFTPLPTDNALMFESIGFEPIYGTTEEENDFDSDPEPTEVPVPRSKRNSFPNKVSKTYSASKNADEEYETEEESEDSSKDSKPTESNNAAEVHGTEKATTDSSKNSKPTESNNAEEVHVTEKATTDSSKNSKPTESNNAEEVHGTENASADSSKDSKPTESNNAAEVHETEKATTDSSKDSKPTESNNAEEVHETEKATTDSSKDSKPTESNNAEEVHGTEKPSENSSEDSKPTEEAVNGTSLNETDDNGEEDINLLSPEKELLETSKVDLAENIRIDKGSLKGEIIDSTSETSALCKTCVWIETKFAEMFGFDHGALYGTAEMIETLSMMDWIFRSMDFNSDGISDNVGFILKDIIVSDTIDIALTGEPIKKNVQVQEHVARKKKKRENFKFDKGEEGYAENQLNTEFEYFLPFEFEDNVYAADNYITENDERQAKDESSHKGRKVRQGESKDNQEERTAPPDTIESVNPQQAYSKILSQMHKNRKFEGCCAMVAFVYADFSPSISLSTLRGLCSRSNLVLVSGMFHNHKITRFDILRALLHGFAHLFGAPHDKTLRIKCNAGKPSSFINPFITHPVHQINVGLRTNSFRMSPCAKTEVVSFLNSNNPRCLEKGKGHYCGNGMLDDGEECDCGSPWQCHEIECCGERDTVFGCKLNRIGKLANCDRPQIW